MGSWPTGNSRLCKLAHNRTIPRQGCKARNSARAFVDRTVAVPFRCAALLALCARGEARTTDTANPTDRPRVASDPARARDAVKLRSARKFAPALARHFRFECSPSLVCFSSVCVCVCARASLSSFGSISVWRAHDTTTTGMHTRRQSDVIKSLNHLSHTRALTLTLRYAHSTLVFSGTAEVRPPSRNRSPVNVKFSLFVVDINSINVEDMDFR